MNNLMDVLLVAVMALFFVLIFDWMFFFDCNLNAYLAQ